MFDNSLLDTECLTFTRGVRAGAGTTAMDDTHSDQVLTQIRNTFLLVGAKL